MRGSGAIYDKSKAFAVRIVKMYRYLSEERKEYVLSKQALRSGTSIGANVREAAYAQSRADFKTKMYIALKEANETAYWLELLTETGYLKAEHGASISGDCEELIKILSSITKTLKDTT